MKGVHYAIAVLAVLAIALLLFVSPAFVVTELDEDLPESEKFMAFMDEETRQEFDEQIDSMADKIVFSQEAMPEQPQILSTTEFMEAAHGVDGRALLVETDGERFLRFEDFNTINGPNLHIYLSSSLDDDDFVDLGPLKATRGNFNYALDDIDTEKYDKVLVWCVPFKVLFSYAELE